MAGRGGVPAAEFRQGRPSGAASAGLDPARHPAVVPRNATELVQQWTNVAGTTGPRISATPSAGYRHQVHGGVVEYHEISGMGHGQPVDPRTQAAQCDTVAGYRHQVHGGVVGILDVNICADCTPI